MRTRDIVVATPEKLDFALRNEPTLIDDVGLVVLDEGHMIGLGEREVRYEVQIQRLLKRPDAEGRRIVCLSAILPRGAQLEDFVSWLRRDKEGSAIDADWRPTRIRFGEVLWRSNHARLELRVGDERPFVPNFFSAKSPTQGKRKAEFPRDQRELVLATAWRLVDDGQSVLIYCPERRSVEPYAEAIIDLHHRGLLPSVLKRDPDVVRDALALGAEWLGERHPILSCLELGVAIHHGALPASFRREIERLLRYGVLKITVSSPTLAQGLNLSATAIVFHSLTRDTKEIPVSEFRNVIGRAGRAFVDVEGLVLYPIFDNVQSRRSQWRRLVTDTGTRSMESGLLRLVYALVKRLHESLKKPSLDALIDYVLNSAWTWNFPEIEGEDEKDRDRALRDWSQYVASLDTAILSLIGEEDIEVAEVANKLDDVLSSSLWARRLLRLKTEQQSVFKRALEARAKTIWTASNAAQRKSYFLAGLGLASGQQLDAIADEANELLVRANAAILTGNADAAIESITVLAERLFSIRPFVPDPFPENWKDVLRSWLLGLRISDPERNDGSDILRFVENGLVYRLTWGMEALRVRAQAHQDSVLGMAMEDYDLGVAVPALETGTLDRAAAILIQAGFPSRLAAIKVVADTDAAFSSAHDLDEWLQSDEIQALSDRADWPSPESAALWKTFLINFAPPERAVWASKSGARVVEWREGGFPPPKGLPVRVRNSEGATQVLSPTCDLIGFLKPGIEDWSGLLIGHVGADSDKIDLSYYGPNDIDLK